ncbi:MAG: glycosyltransferase family 39 protein [Bacteroidales bacterium]|nr:glycosyltransferase family 39 protein [Bacteroidales bacterium]
MNLHFNSKINFSDTSKIIAVIIVIFLYGYLQLHNLGKEQIKIWDEAWKVNNAYEMLHTGNILNSTYNYELDTWNTKPPLLIWCIALSWKISGYSELAIRLPGAIAIFLLLLILILFYKKILNETLPGMLTIIILLTIQGFNHYHVTRIGDPEPLLILFTTAYLLSFLRIYFSESRGTNKNWLHLTFFIICAFFTKGIAGLIPLSGILFFLSLKPQRLVSFFSDKKLYIAGISVLLFVSIYYFISYLNNPLYIQAVLKNEVGLYKEGMEGWIKHPSHWYYLNYIYKEGVAGYFYIFFISLISGLFSKNYRLRITTLYAFIVSLALIVIYSSGTVKNQWYIASIYPLVAIIIANGIITVVKWVISRFSWLERFELLITLLITLAVAKKSFDNISDRPNSHLQKVYLPEREGAAMRYYWHKVDTLNTYIVVTNKNSQNYFYQRFLNEQKGKNITMYEHTDSLKPRDVVLLCQEELIKELQSKCSYDTIEVVPSGGILTRIK